MKPTVADIAVSVLTERNLVIVTWGDGELLDAIAEASKSISNIYGKSGHDRRILVLNRLEKDKRFKKFMYKCFTGSGRGGSGEGQVRGFVLINM